MKFNTTLFAFVAFAAMTSTATANFQTSPVDGHTEAAMTMTMESQDMMTHKTSAFKGIEVNGGSATLMKKDGKWRLRWSDDFKIPGTPAPHWQVVDTEGNVYLLNRLALAGDKTNREIVLPKHIKSVAKIQIWCAFVEVNLGEAAFSKPVRLN